MSDDQVERDVNNFNHNQQLFHNTDRHVTQSTNPLIFALRYVQSIHSQHSYSRTTHPQRKKVTSCTNHLSIRIILQRIGSLPTNL